MSTTEIKWEAGIELSDGSFVADIEDLAAATRDDIEAKNRQLREELEKAGYSEEEIEEELTKIPPNASSLEVICLDHYLLAINNEKNLVWVAYFWDDWDDWDDDL